jgi:hypothetical protein
VYRSGFTNQQAALTENLYILADSPLLQHFCQIGEADRVQVPAKSTLQRYAGWWKKSA